MRILQVYKDVYPFRHGGIERYIHDLSRFLCNRGHQVSVITAGKGKRRKAKTEAGFDVIQVPSFGRILSNPVSFSYGREMRRFRPDVIHFHLPLPTAEVARLLDRSNTPYVATYHSDIVRQAFLLPLYGPLLRKFLRGAFLVLATSRRYLETSPFLSGLENARVVPIGVDLSTFRPGREKTSNYFLFAGRFRSYKGIPVLIEAWKSMLQPPPLILAGGGPLEDWIAGKAGGLPITVIRDPDDEKLLSLYRGAIALVLPSVKRSEAYGMVQLEAMACGTPVISTDLSSGVPWVNRHMESGLIVTPGDSKLLADAVTLMGSDTTLRAKLSQGAAERAVAAFDSEKLFMEVENCLIEAAYRSPRP